MYARGMHIKKRKVAVTATGLWIKGMRKMLEIRHSMVLTALLFCSSIFAMQPGKPAVQYREAREAYLKVPATQFGIKIGYAFPKVCQSCKRAIADLKSRLNDVGLPKAEIIAAPVSALRNAFRLRIERGIAATGGVIHGYGTAFAVGAHRLMTAGHCARLEPGQSLAVEVDGKFIPCTVEKTDFGMDMATLRCQACEFKPVAFDAAMWSTGEIDGSPHGQSIRAIPCRYSDLNLIDHRAAICDGQFMQGCSGAPVMADGKCVGMAVGVVVTPGNLVSYVPAATLSAFLEK